MASIALPILTGSIGAALAGWYYGITLEHSLDTRGDQTWWALKYVLLVVGGFAGGRWAGVVVNASVENVVPETISAYPLVTAAAFLVFGFAVVHAADELVTGE